MVATSAEPAELQPCFDNFRGTLNGYSATDSSPSWENRKAFIDELLGLVPLEEDFEPDSWNDVLSEVEEFLVFWKVYYCGLTPEEVR